MENKPVFAEIIAIGSELLGPGKTDTNSLYLTELLNRFGIEVRFKTVAGDSEDDLISALSIALDRAHIVITTGGLGPTDDDITREAAAKALNRKLILNENALNLIKKRYDSAGVTFRENSTKQAFLIEGGELIPNGPGSAPGTYVESGENTLILLPGVPREMKFMADKFLTERFEKQFSVSDTHAIILNLASIPESLVDSMLETFKFNENNVEYTILASLMRVQIILKSRKKQVLKSLKKDIIQMFGDAFFGEGEVSLQEAVLNALKDKKESLSVAESCTGGLLSKLLTDIPGSSGVFRGGIVCYSNEMKEKLLSVDKNIMIKFGAVSAQVASVLSSEISKLTDSTYGIGITGVAGPTESEAKPAGLVFISVSGKGRTITRKTEMNGSREMVRLRSVRFAFDLLRKEFLIKP